jgi:Cu/Ag efflux pump CusA
MDTEIQKKIEEQEMKIDAILESVEKIRKYFLVSMWITIIVFVLPLIALVFVVPAFVGTYISSLKGLL